jgi:cobaltochelatase CobS
MTTQEIKDNIAKFTAAVERYKDSTNDDEIKMRQSAEQKLKKLEAMLQAAPETPAAATPAPAATPAGGADADIISALASMSNIMLMGGGGADSFEIQKMIEAELAKKKISLAELDASVLEEIRKNQRVTLELPQFGLVIEMDKDDAKIPHIYEMIDDVLAGNNIYLIGDAGSGKTYGAELLCKILNREMTTINCSQYTSPAEIIGGQTIEGYKDGKLVLAWEKGKILLLDEMPKLDPNTAGLLNDALAKSSKTKSTPPPQINSANPDQPPISRNPNFAVIGTGNIYPNSADTTKYVGNNQQDLSLLDRFSGSVYHVTYDDYIDQKSCRYQFLYDMLVGNYYKYMKDKENGGTPPEPKGVRTVNEATNGKNFALTSYRTLTAFRVAFEYQLVRAFANKNKPKAEQTDINRGKTLLKAWHSYLVAYPEDAKRTMITTTKFTDAYVTQQVNDAIDMIVNGAEKGFTQALCPDLRANAAKAYKESKDWMAAMKYIEPIANMSI